MNRTAIIIAALLSTAGAAWGQEGGAGVPQGSHCYGCGSDGKPFLDATNLLNETPIHHDCTVWHILDTKHEERGENWKAETTFADCAKAAANADSHNAIRIPHTLYVVKPESWEPPKANAGLHVEQGIINYKNSDLGFSTGVTIIAPDEFFSVRIPSGHWDMLHGYNPHEGDVVEWYVRGLDCIPIPDTTAGPNTNCRFELAIRKKESAK